MPYAIVETGGKQYRVEPDDLITVEKIAGDEGATVELDRVLLVQDDDGVRVGAPTVEGVRVVAEIVSQGKADKLTVFKYKPKVRYSRKQGHRQQVTRLAIKNIATGELPARGRQRRRRRTSDGA